MGSRRARHVYCISRQTWPTSVQLQSGRVETRQFKRVFIVSWLNGRMFVSVVVGRCVGSVVGGSMVEGKDEYISQRSDDC